MRRISGFLTVALSVAGTLTVAAAEIQPHMAGWERLFTIKWEAGVRGERPVVQGRIENISPYSIRDVRILVDALDGSGNVTAQRVAFVPGDLVGFGSVSAFEVPMPAAPAYRVRVYTYDRIEAGSDHR